MRPRTPDRENISAGLNVLNQVYLTLEGKGLPPTEAAAHVLAGVANQAAMNGMNPKDAIDALHRVISIKQERAHVEAPKATRRVIPLTPQQAQEIKDKLKFLQTFLLYWDIILCTEIQRYACLVLSLLKDKGLYRHELKKYANALTEEARKLQIRAKDSDRILVRKWCSKTDERNVYAQEFQEDGGSIIDKFVLAYQKEFESEWKLVELDCHTVASKHSPNLVGIVENLFKVDALTNTGVELYDSCVQRMKALTARHGTSSITKSTHHESMRHACRNLLDKLGFGRVEISETEAKYAREHLRQLQTSMMNAGMGDMFQIQLDHMTKDFVDYMLAWMCIDTQLGSLKTGAKRMALERLGTKHRARKFFQQLQDIEIPTKENIDVFDVAECITTYQGKRGEIDRFCQYCIEGKKFELPESWRKQEYRILRITARRNNYMLPDQSIRAMVMKYGTKKAVLAKLADAGFELEPTLRKIKKMKAVELKQL